MRTAILKTWPSFMTRSHTLEVFGHEWARFYFSLGRGRPAEPISELYFTHRGEIIGSFRIAEIVRNEGQLPKLQSLSGEESEWQIKPDAWVAICDPPFRQIDGEKLFYEGFRGYRYFDIDKYRSSFYSKVRL